MFSIAFVAVTVRARAAGLDRSLEAAAMDLGATPVTAFFKVTLPLLAPGILAGFLLAFALSMDDFVISEFVQGPFQMFPTWVFGATRVGIPPHVFVFATIIFLTGAIARHGAGPGVAASARRRRVREDCGSRPRDFVKTFTSSRRETAIYLRKRPSI